MMLQDRDGQVVEAHLGVGRPRLPGRRAADRGAGRRRPARGRGGDRRRGVRGDALAAADRGHPAGARDAPTRSPSLPRLLAGAEGTGGAVPGRGRSCSSGCPDAATRTSRRSGGGCDAARPRDGDDRVAPDASGTNETAGARRIARSVRRRPGRRPGRARSRTSSPATRTRRRASRPRSPRSTPAPTCSRSACRTRDPLADGATLQRASQVALAAGATLDGALALIERIARGAPGVPLVPMGYANQFIGGGDGARPPRRLADAGAAGVIVADLTPDEGAPFEAVAREHGLAVVYLVAPTTPPDRRAAIAARSGGFLYCVSLVGVTGARTSAAVDGRPPRPRRVGRLAGPGRGRVRRQPAGPRPGARQGRRRRRDRRVGARRRARRRTAGTSTGASSALVAGAFARPALPSRVTPVVRMRGSRSRSRPRQEGRSRPRSTGRAGAASGKTEELALEALLAYAPRYAPRCAAGRARRSPRRPASDLEVVERDGRRRDRLRRPEQRHRRTTERAARRREAPSAWLPRRGRRGRPSTGSPPPRPRSSARVPRGGGRDRDKMVAHVIGADRAYASEIGIKLREPDPRDRRAVEADARRVLEVLRQPSDGSPLAGRVDRRATPPTGSPGTPSTTPGRSRTASEPEA